MENYSVLYSLAWKLLAEIDPGLVRSNPGMVNRYINSIVLRALSTVYRDCGYRPLFILPKAQKNIRLVQLIEIVTKAILQGNAKEMIAV